MVDDSAPVEVDLGHLAENAQVDGALAIDGLHLVFQAIVGAAGEEEHQRSDEDNEWISHDVVRDYWSGCRVSSLCLDAHGLKYFDLAAKIMKKNEEGKTFLDVFKKASSTDEDFSAR